MGNRTGLLAPRYELPADAAFVNFLGMWGNRLARAREFEIGRHAYATELGLI